MYSIREDLLIAKKLFFEEQAASFEYHPDLLQFQWWIGEEKVFAVSSDGISSEVPTNVVVVNPNPILCEIEETPLYVTTDQEIAVDTGLTQIRISNLLDPLPVTVIGDVTGSASITELWISNLHPTHPVKITETVSVDTGLTQIRISNLQEIHPVEITGVPGVNIGTTALWISNLENPHKVLMTGIPEVNIGTTALWISNLLDIHPVTVDNTVTVETGITEIRISNLMNPHPVSVSNIPTVNLGISEIGVSHFPNDPLQVNITAQTLPALEVMTTGGSQIATKNTFDNILSTIKTILPYPDQFISSAKCIYSSNYKALISVVSVNSDQYFNEWEHDVFSNIVTGLVEPTIWGLTINYNPVGGGQFAPCTYDRGTRFYVYPGGKTLITYDMANLQIPVGAPHAFTYRFGLAELNSNPANDASQPRKVYIQARTSTSLSFVSGLQVVIRWSGSESTAIINDEIDRVNFNIDPLDGTGPSGFTWTDDTWQCQKFWIMVNEYFHYTLGIMGDTTMIPMHTFIYNKPSNTVGFRMPALRPYFRIRKETSGIVDTRADFLGFRIYKDVNPIMYQNYTRNGVETNIDLQNETPIITFKKRVSGEYSGNLQFKVFNVISSRRILLTIRYGNSDNPLEIDSGSYFGQHGALRYERNGTRLGNGWVIYQQIIRQNSSTYIDLEKHIPWTLWGSWKDAGDDHEFMFLMQHVDTSVNPLTNVDWNISWEQY